MLTFEVFSVKPWGVAGLAALVLGACVSPSASDSADAGYAAWLAQAPEAYIVTTDDDLLAQAPKPQADTLKFLGEWVDWALAPGHVVERAHLLFAPPGVPEGTDVIDLYAQLADAGHRGAQLFEITGEPDELERLAEEFPVIRFGLKMQNLQGGSLAQKIDALGWMRSHAAGNNDVAMTLGEFLINQGGAFDGFMDMELIATDAELREGVALLKHAARATSVPVMDQITRSLDRVATTAAADDKALRTMLEALVSATEAPPLGGTEDLGALLESADSPEFSARQIAAGARTRLAILLEAGRGGPADPERAKALYTEAILATPDIEALQGLERLGVDISRYEEMYGHLFEGWEDWEDQPAPDTPVPAPPAAEPSRQ